MSIVNSVKCHKCTYQISIEILTPVCQVSVASHRISCVRHNFSRLYSMFFFPCVFAIKYLSQITRKHTQVSLASYKNIQGVTALYFCNKNVFFCNAWLNTDLFRFANYVIHKFFFKKSNVFVCCYVTRIIVILQICKYTYLPKSHIFFSINFFAKTNWNTLYET